MKWEWSWNLIRIRKKEYKELLEKAKKYDELMSNNEDGGK